MWIGEPHLSSERSSPTRLSALGNTRYKGWSCITPSQQSYLTTRQTQVVQCFARRMFRAFIKCLISTQVWDDQHIQLHVGLNCQHPQLSLGFRQLHVGFCCLHLQLYVGLRNIAIYKWMWIWSLSAMWGHKMHQNAYLNVGWKVSQHLQQYHTDARNNE